MAITSVVGFLVVMEFASGMLQGWFSPLLPSIMERYDVTAADLNWVSAVYLLSTVVCVPLIAKLGDLYGHRRLLLIATCLVAAGSIVVATAPSFGVLLIGRALQGPLAAFLPLEFAIVRERGGDRAGRAIGVLVGALTLGASVGLLVAGLARQNMSLTATLWIPAGLMLLAIPVVARLVPETTIRKAGGIDWRGAALLGLGLVAVLGAVGNGSRWGWTSALTLGGIVGGLLLLGLWVLVETRVADPLVDLSMVVRGGLGLPLLMALLVGAQLFGAQTPSAVFLGLQPATAGFGLGLSAGPLGAALLVFGFAAFVGTVVAPRLGERFGPRPALLVGSAVTAIAYGLMAVAHGALAPFLTWQFLAGIGNGIVLATLPAVIVKRAPADSVGIASGLYNTARTAAGAIAGAGFAALMAAMFVIVPGADGTPKAISSESAYATVWLICAALSLAVGVLAVWLRRPNAAASKPVSALPTSSDH